MLAWGGGAGATSRRGTRDAVTSYATGTKNRSGQFAGERAGGGDDKQLLQRTLYRAGWELVRIYLRGGVPTRGGAGSNQGGLTVKIAGILTACKFSKLCPRCMAVWGLNRGKWNNVR